MTTLELASWIAAFVMFGAFVLEAVISRFVLGDHHYEVPDTLVSVAIMAGYVLTRVGVGALTTLAMIALWSATPLRWSMDAWWHWLVLFLLEDFIAYASHWAGHVVPFLWASHAVHHNSPKLNLSTGLRNSWIGVFYDWMFFIPIVALGFHPLHLAAVVAFGSAWDFLSHTPYIGKLPWFDAWANSPANHRVHHAKNPRYIDKNFASALVIWDRLFGTYEPESEPPVFGIVDMPARPHNPFYLEFYLWAAIVRRWFARSPRLTPET